MTSDEHLASSAPAGPVPQLLQIGAAPDLLRVPAAAADRAGIVQR